MKQFRTSGSRRLVGVAGAVLALAGGVVLAPSAEASSVTNHIYISDHGSPSCGVVFELYDKNGFLASSTTKTMVGKCRWSLAWDPDNYQGAKVKIDSATVVFHSKYDSTTGAGHDHCILVKAFGTIEYTGDETQGCNGD